MRQQAQTGNEKGKQLEKSGNGIFHYVTVK